jgi:hypothetical protein
MGGSMKKSRIAFEVIGLVIFAALGVWTAHAVGLYGAAEAGIMKLGIAGGAAYYFAASFWAALHR